MKLKRVNTLARLHTKKHKTKNKTKTRRKLKIEMEIIQEGIKNLKDFQTFLFIKYKILKIPSLVMNIIKM